MISRTNVNEPNLGNQENRLNILVKTLLIAGIAIVCCTIGVYALHSHISFFGDIDDKTFGIFGDFIGGFVGTIFNIIVTYLVWITYKSQKQETADTKNLLLKQISVSYMPDVYIKDNFVNANIVTFSNGDTINIEVKNADDSEGKNSPHLNLINIGVAAAKDFNYKWNYDINACLKFLNINAPDSRIVFELENDGNWLKAYTNEDNAYYLQVTSMLEFQRFDILLPYRGKADERGVILPLPYLATYLMAVEQDWTKLLHGSKTEPAYKQFPSLQLALKYKDLENELHQKVFDIKFDVLSLSPSRDGHLHSQSFELKVTGFHTNL